MKNSPKIVIAIDGGGIRGIIPLVILRNIFETFPTFQSKIQWWGTSAGALISASIVNNKAKGLNYLMSSQYTLDFFEFRSNAMLETSEFSISNRPFKTLLTNVFGDLKISAFENLNILATEIPSFMTKIFNLETEVDLVNALRASCAVPGVFPPIEIDNKKYVDGFLTAKNPTLIAITKENLNEGDLVLSIGTGVLKESDQIEIEVARVHNECERILLEKGVHYLRLNPVLKKASSDMQNLSPKNIFNLKQDTFEFLHSNGTSIQNLKPFFMEH